MHTVKTMMLALENAVQTINRLQFTKEHAQAEDQSLHPKT